MPHSLLLPTLLLSLSLLTPTPEVTLRDLPPSSSSSSTSLSSSSSSSSTGEPSKATTQQQQYQQQHQFQQFQQQQQQSQQQQQFQQYQQQQQSQPQQQHSQQPPQSQPPTTPPPPRRLPPASLPPPLPLPSLASSLHAFLSPLSHLHPSWTPRTPLPRWDRVATSPSRWVNGFHLDLEIHRIRPDLFTGLFAVGSSLMRLVDGGAGEGGEEEMKGQRGKRQGVLGLAVMDRMVEGGEEEGERREVVFPSVGKAVGGNVSRRGFFLGEYVETAEKGGASHEGKRSPSSPLSYRKLGTPSPRLANQPRQEKSSRGSGIFRRRLGGASPTVSSGSRISVGEVKPPRPSLSVLNVIKGGRSGDLILATPKEGSFNTPVKGPEKGAGKAPTTESEFQAESSAEGTQSGNKSSPQESDFPMSMELLQPQAMEVAEEEAGTLSEKVSPKLRISATSPEWELGSFDMGSFSSSKDSFPKPVKQKEAEKESTESSPSHTLVSPPTQSGKPKSQEKVSQKSIRTQGDCLTQMPQQDQRNSDSEATNLIVSEINKESGLYRRSLQPLLSPPPPSHIIPSHSGTVEVPHEPILQPHRPASMLNVIRGGRSGDLILAAKETKTMTRPEASKKSTSFHSQGTSSPSCGVIKMNETKPTPQGSPDTRPLSEAAPSPPHDPFFPYHDPDFPKLKGPGMMEVAVALLRAAGPPVPGATYVQLDASYMGLSGTPNWAALPPELLELHMNNNRLTGTLSFMDFPHGIQVIQLSSNCLHGSLELSELPCTLRALHLNQNRFTGSLDLTQLPSGILMVSLSHNRFTGEIELGSLPVTLFVLALDHNRLTGGVNLGGLAKNIVYLDISKNRFTTVGKEKCSEFIVVHL